MDSPAYFPKSPTADDRAERDLVAIELTDPNATTTTLSEIPPVETRNKHLRALREIIGDIHERHIPVSLENVLVEINDEPLKDLARYCVDYAGSVHITDDLVRHVTSFFERRRKAEENKFTVRVGGNIRLNVNGTHVNLRMVELGCHDATFVASTSTANKLKVNNHCYIAVEGRDKPAPEPASESNKEILAKANLKAAFDFIAMPGPSRPDADNGATREQVKAFNGLLENTMGSAKAVGVKIPVCMYWPWALADLIHVATIIEELKRAPNRWLQQVLEIFLQRIDPDSPNRDQGLIDSVEQSIAKNKAKNAAWARKTIDSLKPNGDAKERLRAATEFHRKRVSAPHPDDEDSIFSGPVTIQNIFERDLLHIILRVAHYRERVVQAIEPADIEHGVLREIFAFYKLGTQPKSPDMPFVAAYVGRHKPKHHINDVFVDAVMHYFRTKREAKQGAV